MKEYNHTRTYERIFSALIFPVIQTIHTSLISVLSILCKNQNGKMLLSFNCSRYSEMLLSLNCSRYSEMVNIRKRSIHKSSS